MADLSLKYLLLGEDRSASKSIRGVADTAEQSSRRFDGASKVWQAGAALAGAAVVKFGIDTVNAASDQAEVVSKSTIIFGDNADEMIAWASTADTSMGLSKTAALEAASGFGDMFLQLGFARNTADDMSRSVVGLAADLGSFNNLPTAEVADMISAAFRGEYDSLQRLVPNINAARVETEALAMTGKKNASELTAQEKAAATLAIITKDSARAQGDFARTADGAANSQKILAAEFDNAKAALGDRLLPAWTTALHLMSDGVGVLGTVVDTMSSVPPTVYAAVAAMVAWNLAGDRVEAVGGRVAKSTRGMADNIRLAGMYAKDAGGGFAGLKAGLSTFTGGLTAGQAATSGLKSAGSSLFGLLGGPWGIAITGATALVGAWAQAQADAQADADALTGSIEKQSGTWTQASREIVANKIQFDVNQDDLAMLEKAGVDLGKLADEVLNGGPAFDSRIAQLQAMANRSGNLGIAARGLLLTMERERDAAISSYGAFQTKNKILGDTTATTKDAAAEGDIFAGVVDGVGAAAAGAKIDMQGVNDQLAEFVDVTMSARGAARDYESAVDDATAAVKENGRTLNIHTEAGRKNQAALDRIAESALDVAEADLKAGKSTGEVTAKVNAAREAFIKAAIKMGASKDEARRLASQLGLTSGQVQTLNGKINGLPAAKSTKVTVPTGTATTQARRIREEIADIKGKNVPVTIKVWGLGALEAAQGLLSGINGIAGSLNFGHNARGTSSWRGGLTWVGEEGPELVDLPGGTSIYDANTSSSMAASGSGGGGDINLTVNLRAPDGRVMQTELLKLKRTTGPLGLA